MSVHADDGLRYGGTPQQNDALAKAAPKRPPEVARILSVLDDEINRLQTQIDELASRLQPYMRDEPRVDGLDKEPSEAPSSEFTIALNVASIRIRSSRQTITALIDRMEI